MTLNSILSYSIIYQSSINHLSHMFRYCLLFTSEIFDPIYPISRTPSELELRRRGSDFGRTLCGCCRLFFRALPWHHGHRGHRDAATRCHTQVVSNTGYWVNWWTNISLSPPYLTWWVLLRKGNTSIQSNAMNLQFIILGPLWTSNQQAALFYSGLNMFRPSEWQSISMIS